MASHLRISLLLSLVVCFKFHGTEGWQQGAGGTGVGGVGGGGGGGGTPGGNWNPGAAAALAAMFARQSGGSQGGTGMSPGGTGMSQGNTGMSQRSTGMPTGGSNLMSGFGAMGRGMGGSRRMSMSAMRNFAVGHAVLSSDRMKKASAITALRSQCVQKDPILKILLMDYMDIPLAAAMIPTPGYPPINPIMYQTITKFDNVKRMQAMRKSQSPCVMNNPSLGAVLTDIGDMPLAATMLG